MKSRILFLMVCTIIAVEVQAQLSKKTKVHNISTKILVDSLDRSLFRNYIFPEKSTVMGDFIKGELKRGAYKNITDPRQLAERLTKDLQSVHRDPHLRVNYDPAFSQILLTPPKPFKPGDDSLWIQSAKADNFSFKKVEILGGNIGYVKFTGFNGFVKDATPTASAAFRFVANADAVIIDLRDNGGGSPWMVKQIASYFVTERTRLNDIYERKGDNLMEFWAEPELAENMKLSMPVYILCNAGTASAAEDFTYAMQVNKRAVVVGDTTAGAAHPTGPVAIGQGFVVSMPFARSINHITKTDWEGTGVIPDVVVPAENILQKTHALILEKALTHAKTDIEKRKKQWALNSLYVQEYEKSTAMAYNNYSGEFRNFVISVKDNELYFKDSWGHHRLKPISDVLFSAGEWLQIEFVQGSDEKISRLRLLDRNGGEEVVDRSR